MSETNSAPQPIEPLSPHIPQTSSTTNSAPQTITMSATTSTSNAPAEPPPPTTPKKTPNLPPNSPGTPSKHRNSPSLSRAAGEVFSFLSGVATAAAGAITSTLAERRYLSLTANVKLDWREDTKKIWLRPIDKLPIDIDLPRLASRITLLDKRQQNIHPEDLIPNDLDSEIAPPPNAPPSPGGTGQTNVAARNYDAVLEFLWKSAYILEGKQQAIRIKSVFQQMISRGADLSVQKPTLKKFIIEIIGPESKLGHLLKAINQAIIAPANIEAHLNTLPGLLFKDSQTKPWEVEVRVEDTSIEVAHLRGQCHFDQKALDTAFDFVLETSITFDKTMKEIIGLNIYIVEFGFTPQTNEARKTELTALFTAHQKPKNQTPASPIRQITHVGRRSLAHTI